MMLVSDFDYHLPRELIAQIPLAQRDQSRMMIVNRRSGSILHSRFKKFPDYLKEGDVLVLNAAKVIPARVWGRIGRDEIEFLFLKEKRRGLWEVLCRPARKVKSNEIVIFASGFEGKVVEVQEEGKSILQFSRPEVLENLKKIGSAPLPPYIKRKKYQRELKKLDLERYQTVYAQKEGAIAAPTAGLHFTPEVLAESRKKGVVLVKISLDVGLATFKPVRARTVENHRMLEESYSISAEAADEIEKAKQESRPVIAVGTTVVRAVESAYQNGRIRRGTSSTDLFIYPGYEFRVIDRLLTNFHLPKSTLIMMVSAFSSIDLIKKAYLEAIQKKYRFYSYGDCMFII